jgi:hypothetical protein
VFRRNFREQAVPLERWQSLLDAPQKKRRKPLENPVTVNPGNQSLLGKNCWKFLYIVCHVPRVLTSLVFGNNLCGWTKGLEREKERRVPGLLMQKKHIRKAERVYAEKEKARLCPDLISQMLLPAGQQTYLLSRILFHPARFFSAFLNKSAVSPSMTISSITSFCSMLLTTF